MLEDFSSGHTKGAAAFGLFLLGIVALLASGLYVRSVANAAFRDADRIRNARAHVNDMLRHQLDEETGVRGYAATRLSIFLQPYRGGRRDLALDFKRLQAELDSLKINEARPALRDAELTNYRWLHEVALPLIRSAGRHVSIELHGKALVDRFRVDSSTIYADLSRRTALTTTRAHGAVVLIGTFAAAAVAFVLFASFAFTIQLRKVSVQLAKERTLVERERQRSIETRSAYDSEKHLADTMQEALLQRDFPELPSVSFSAVYIPATEESRIGGDWYDALPLPEGKILLAIGDVTGHGVDAVVAMNRARQLLTRSALIDADPAAILNRANLELVSLGSPIITAISAVVDTRRFELTYAVAGHPPPVLFEPEHQARLLKFGSLPLGVTRDALYQTEVVRTRPGAMIVLYTDGAIEYSRDVLAGEAALLNAVELAAKRPRGQAANAIRDNIFNFDRIADDVAILTIRLWEMPEHSFIEATTKLRGSRELQSLKQFSRHDSNALRRSA